MAKCCYEAQYWRSWHYHVATALLAVLLNLVVFVCGGAGVVVSNISILKMLLYAIKNHISTQLTPS